MKQQKELSFQTQSYGLNATINAQNQPLHSYHSPKTQARLVQTTSQQQVTNLILPGGSNKSLT